MHPIRCASVVFIGFAILCLRPLAAQPKDDAVEFKSPDENYSVRVLMKRGHDVGDLKIFRRRQLLAHYPFEGQLVSAYWSPSGKYIALNNHFGHLGWWPWIISLKDGGIISAEASIKLPTYDRYEDYTYLPDLAESERTSIEKIYGGYAQDQMRLGYTSIAYGWKGGDRLLMFHELPLDKLYEKDQSLICLYTTIRVRDSLRPLPQETVAEEIKIDLEETNIPAEISKTRFFQK